jgi:rubredoxin
VGRPTLSHLCRKRLLTRAVVGQIFVVDVVERNKESVVSEVIEYKSWVCLICGWIYNEEDGVPEEGIAAGTRFADIPDTWRCPLCDVGKSDFAAVEF